jgi:MYXO-CTERM domain-containing protein
MTLLTFLLIPASFAATHTVDATGGADFTSLQAAVDAAESGDSIIVNSSTYNENVTISAKSLYIEGAGSSTTTIWGDGTEEVLTIENAAVNLSGIAIMNGRRGIALRGAVVSLTGLLVEDNGGAERGGGIAVLESSDANISDVTIRDNSSSTGGGVYLDSTSVLQLSDSTVNDNTATDDGAGIYTMGSLTVFSTLLQDNTADGNGGGLYATGISPDIVDCDFWGNEADNGGGIALDNVSVGSIDPRIKTSEFWLNSASTDGGAIWLNSASTMYLKQLLIILNEAGGDGGGLWVTGGQPWTTFARTWNNSAMGNGGGAFIKGVYGGATRKSSFGGNMAGGSGGGAYHMNPNASHPIYNNRYIENSATDGGGLVIDNDGNKRFTTSNIDVVGNAGGGISIVNSGLAKVVNAIVAWNTDAGMSADETSSPAATLKNNDVYSNDSDYSDSLSDLTGTNGNISEDPSMTRFEMDGDPISDFLYLGDTSPCRNTGKGDISNRDGSRSDMGSYGGPDAEGGDEDGDGAGPGAGDCDDGDAAATPGATEIEHDGRDNDCEGGGELDLDGDGSLYPTDCDDNDAEVYPGATDIPGDGVDADCDGLDGDDPGGDDTGGPPAGADTGAPWVDQDTGGEEDPYTDADRDGYTGDEDCNDADPTAHIDADEICDDGIDNDCDGATDTNDTDCAAGDTKGCGCAATPNNGGWFWMITMLAALAGRRRP